MTKTYTPRDAYDDIHKRTYIYLTIKKIPHDKAMRLSTLEAVHWTWIEYNITKGLETNRTL